MASGQRSDNRDDPVEGNDPAQGQQRAQTQPSSANGDQPDGQHGSPESVKRPAPTPAKTLEQPGAYQGPVRDVCNLIRWMAVNEEAQEGVDYLLRSVARRIMLPAILLIFLLMSAVAAVIAFDSIPHVSLALKIITSAATTTVISIATLAFKRKLKRPRPKLRPAETVSDDSGDDHSGPSGDNG